MSLLADKILTVLISPNGFAIALGTAALLMKLVGWQRLPRLLVVFALLSLWAFSTPILARVLMGSLESQYAALPIAASPAVDVAIVLGGSTRFAAPPQRPEIDITDAGDRIWHAIQLYKLGKVRAILVSGGNLPWMEGAESEARSIAHLMQLWGVPESVILVEGRSRNTHENALESKRLLAESNYHSALLVTSSAHMPRAYATFRKVGLFVVPSPTDIRAAGEPYRNVLDFLPDADMMAMSSDAIREWAGYCVYWARGWL